MNYNPTTTIRIPPEIKRDATDVFKELGITMSVAINAFLSTVARTGRVPIELEVTPSGGHREFRDLEPDSPKNAMLNRAFRARKDEFFTLYEDVEAELSCYPGRFAGKRVLCNCDDPFESAFFRYFLVNFEELGLASLSSTCYAAPSLKEREYDLVGSQKPYATIVTAVPDTELTLPDGSLDLESVFEMEENSIFWLKGDGDFRSQECVDLLRESDVVVTNPPFSLFREYVAQLSEHDKSFLILGNMNASTYREIFPMFRDDQLWYGQSIRSGDRKFYVPDSYPLSAANCGIDEAGRRFIRVKGVRWFTNMENGRRHERLELKSRFDPAKYVRFDNYDAIEVSKTMDIPNDYDGLMGVPITFLDRYNPAQFEIVMLANGNARTNVGAETLKLAGYVPDPADRGGVGLIGGQRSYARILIRKVAA